jgi:2-keto-3-deoxy-L-rhamnonate aldolase RhmA
MMLPAYWPKENRFRTMLREGPPPMIMWITLDSVNVVEMLGSYGVDAVIVDCEHTSTGLEQAQNKIVAAELAGMTTFVRPSQALPRVLFTGGVEATCISDAVYTRVKAVRARISELGLSR